MAKEMIGNGLSVYFASPDIVILTNETKNPPVEIFLIFKEIERLSDFVSRMKTKQKENK